jgi:hypothetical protein
MTQKYVLIYRIIMFLKIQKCNLTFAQVIHKVLVLQKENAMKNLIVILNRGHSGILRT